MELHGFKPDAGALIVARAIMQDSEECNWVLLVFNVVVFIARFRMLQPAATAR